MANFLDHWFLALCYLPLWLVVIWAGYCVSVNLCNLLMRIWTRMWPSLVVLCRGWPPAHLDQFGDWKPEPKKEEKK